MGAFFWVSIPFERYQNTSGCGTAQHHCFLTSIKLDTSNVFTRIITEVLFWCIAKLKLALTFMGINILNPQSKNLSLFSVTFSPCKLNFWFATELNFKNGCLCYIRKKFWTKQKNRKGYVQPDKKMRKGLCFAIVSIK